MENLRKKTFFTIFIIISLFAIFFATFFNVQTYHREYIGILNNLTRMKNLTLGKPNFPDKGPINDDRLRNRKVMDYEVYTFILDENNNIMDKISHSDNSISKKIMTQVQNIIEKTSSSHIKIGCLYLRNYAYNFEQGKYLTIIDTSNTKSTLLTNLLLSFLLILIGEIFIYIISKKITEWITKPVEMSFSREKEFVANASHELKTPLAVIMASIDCLDVNKNNEKWINNLKSESDRMNNLITKLLDLSKSEYLKSENFSKNNLSMIVEKRALTFESLAYEKNITIDTNITEKINFLCHKESMDELVSILVDNAISHGSENSKIEVDLSSNKNEINLKVINKGDPIPLEECEKIFERFYRNDKSHNRKSGRYGLGLSIAKNIVFAHHGNIKAYSKDGYTTFEVQFKTNEHYEKK